MRLEKANPIEVSVGNREYPFNTEIKRADIDFTYCMIAMSCFSPTHKYNALKYAANENHYDSL